QGVLYVALVVHIDAPAQFQRRLIIGRGLDDLGQHGQGCVRLILRRIGVGQIRLCQVHFQVQVGRVQGQGVLDVGQGRAGLVVQYRGAARVGVDGGVGGRGGGGGGVVGVGRVPITIGRVGAGPQEGGGHIGRVLIEDAGGIRDRAAPGAHAVVSPAASQQGVG